MSKLALLGGEKEVKESLVFLRSKFSEEDLKELSGKLNQGLLYDASGKGTIRELELMFAELLGKKHALAVSSGTIALLSAYFGLGLREPDEFLVPCYGYHASVFGILKCEATRILCEIERETTSLDAKNLETMINQRIKGMTIVPMWGLPADYKKLREIKEKSKIRIVEDASRSLGAKRGGIIAGELGDVICVSLNTYKAIGVGEGGVLATDDDECYDRAVVLGQPVNFTIKSKEYLKYFETGFGIKSKIHPVSAFLALKAIERFQQRLDQCNENFQYFNDKMEGNKFLRILTPPEGSLRGGWSGVSMIYNSDEIDGLDINTFIKALKAEGCSVSVEYDSNLLHTTPAYQSNLVFNSNPRFKRGDFPSSESIIGRMVIIENICSYQERADNIIDQYVSAISKVFDNRRRLIQGEKE